MQKQELWEIFVKKNPHWLTDGANLSPAGLKKLFETTFDKGHEQGLANGRVLGEKEAVHGKVGKFMDGLFGGR